MWWLYPLALCFLQAIENYIKSWRKSTPKWWKYCFQQSCGKPKQCGSRRVAQIMCLLVKILTEQLVPVFIIHSAQFLPPVLQLSQALPSSIVRVCLCCFGGVQGLSGLFLPHIRVTPGSKLLHLSFCVQPAGHPAVTVPAWLRLSFCTPCPPSSTSSLCPLHPCPTLLPPSQLLSSGCWMKSFGLKSLSELWKAFYYLPGVTCLWNSCKLFWLFLLADCFFPHSSAAGQDGVHLASVLTKDKWALGPQWFTLAARGFQNSKLFFITAMWYEVSCSRCSNIYYSRLQSGEFIKVSSFVQKSHLSEWLAFCLCQLRVHSPGARRREGVLVVQEAHIEMELWS